MANEKRVTNKPVVELAPAATPTSYTDYSVWFDNIELKFMRVSTDVAAYGDAGAATAKAHRDHSVTFSCFHSQAFTDFSAFLFTEFAADGNTMVKVKYQDASISADNPQFRFAIKVHSLGSLGGQRGAASKLSETFKIEGYVEKTVDGSTWTNI